MGAARAFDKDPLLLMLYRELEIENLLDFSISHFDPEGFTVVE